MKVLPGLVAGAVVVGVVAIAAIKFREPSESSPRRQPKARPVLEAVPSAAWGEEHPAIMLHAAPSKEIVDTAWVSRGIADIPQSIVENGGTLHFRITQPEWAVFDDRGEQLWQGDEVVLTAVLPEVGIGLELTRVVINPHKKAADRRWHKFEVKIPRCTRRIRLEVLAGEDVTANNAYDNLLVAVDEPLVFLNGVVRGRSDRPHCTRLKSGSCGNEPLPPSCPKGERINDPVASPAGALRTGASLKP